MAEDFTLPAFLQDCDVDTIHQRMMDMLPDDIDKRRYAQCTNRHIGKMKS